MLSTARKFIGFNVKVGLLASVCFTPLASFGQGVPTADARNLLQELKNFELMVEDLGVQNEQLSSLFEQIALLEEQINKIDEINKLLSNPTDIIALIMEAGLNDVLEEDFKAELIDLVIKGAQGDWSGVTGEKAAEIVEKIAGALENAGTSQDEIEALAASEDVAARNNAIAATSSATTSAAAEIAFEEASISRQRVVRLVDEIPNLDSLKASVDHNTRVTAELAIALAAMWQLESVQTMNDGMGGVLDAATAAEVQGYYDFTLPDF